MLAYMKGSWCYLQIKLLLRTSRTSLDFQRLISHFLPGMKDLSSVNGFECERLNHNVIQRILIMEGNCEKWTIEDAIQYTMVFLTTRLHCYIHCVCKVQMLVNMLKLMCNCVIDMNMSYSLICTLYLEYVRWKHSLSLSVALTSFMWVAKL